MKKQMMPLESFPEAHRNRILEAVAQPTPPPKWINVGFAQIQSRAWYEWHVARGRVPGGSGRSSLPPATRAAVIERDGYVCKLCGEDVEPDDVHIDHIHPVSKGGSDKLDNLQVAHSLCNIKKGARV